MFKLVSRGGEIEPRVVSDGSEETTNPVAVLALLANRNPVKCESDSMVLEPL